MNAPLYSTSISRISSVCPPRRVRRKIRRSREHQKMEQRQELAVLQNCWTLDRSKQCLCSEESTEFSEQRYPTRTRSADEEKSAEETDRSSLAMLVSPSKRKSKVLTRCRRAWREVQKEVPVKTARDDVKVSQQRLSHCNSNTSRFPAELSFVTILVSVNVLPSSQCA
jgi:hypothetical protein